MRVTVPRVVVAKPVGARETRAVDALGWFVLALVFGSASLGLWQAGQPGWALALLVFSVVVNALALLPFVRRLVPEPAR